jgi:hypothetical protein
MDYSNHLDPDEWECECGGINPIVTGRCWLCGHAGRRKRLLAYEQRRKPE